MNMGSVIPDYIQKLFWDVKKDSVNLDNHAHFIIRRVLDFGDAKAVNWLCKVYPDTLIKEVVQLKKGFARKTLIFWTEHYNHFSKNV
jgi:hypothetical protein